MQRKTTRHPWAWIPTLYFAEGLPYIVIMAVAVVFYKNMGLSNKDIALYTSLLYLPWVIKPLWSPFVDICRTKRLWIVSTQLLLGAGLAGIALTIPLDDYFRYTMALFTLMAFSSATHDIAADGFYMLAMPADKQAFFVGIRSTFYRASMWFGQGLLVIFAGMLEKATGSITMAWSITFYIMAGLFLIFFAYHQFMLPYPERDKPAVNENSRGILPDFVETFVLFFKKKDIVMILAFLLLFRLAEAQLVKLAQPFMLDDVAKGGLGLSTEEVGTIYGTIGIIALTVGGILGGIAASLKGLKYWLLLMVIAINLPDAVYVYLSFAQPESFFLISLSVAVEQFGYGFGFTAYMLFMIYATRGAHQTSHFAIATGFMALGMMLPGMVSGWIQETIGYQHFFIWVLVATIPGFIVASLVKIDPNFGKKTKETGPVATKAAVSGDDDKGQSTE